MAGAKATNERSWVNRWAAASGPLAAERRRALAALTEDEGAEAALALLDLAAKVPPDPRRRPTSGLIEQQALLHRRRRP
jgi:hypothetical protein